MIGFILLFILIITIIYIVKNRIIIKFKTFFKKGFRANRGNFGVYCYCGKQGRGKTLSVIEFLNENKDKKIYANIKTIDKDKIEYTYFNGFDNLLKLRDEHDCIIVYDEIFTALTKSSKINQDVLDFLSQMRKRRIIFITTAQEWLEINITLRRYCRYQIECNIINVINTSILIKRFYDAEQMTWSQQDNEYVAPILRTSISKCNLHIAQMYDTFEQIKT